MEIKETVLELLRGINPGISDDMEADLLKSGAIDSYEIVNVVMELEDAFGIEIDPEQIIPSNFQTIANIIKLIEELLEEK